MDIPERLLPYGNKRDEQGVVRTMRLIATNQFAPDRPELFLNQSPEAARLDPSDLIIAVDHIKCGIELAFRQGESFGTLSKYEISSEVVLNQRGERYYWMNDAFPAHGISLRSSDQENVVIVDQTDVPNRVIGEMDTFSAMTLLHDEAIYLHGADQYQVEVLDFEEKKAFVRAVDVDYYTDANFSVELSVLDEDESYTNGAFSVARDGEMSVSGEWRRCSRKSSSEPMKTLALDRFICRSGKSTRPASGFHCRKVRHQARNWNKCSKEWPTACVALPRCI